MWSKRNWGKWLSYFIKFYNWLKNWDTGPVPGVQETPKMHATSKEFFFWWGEGSLLMQDFKRICDKKKWAPYLLLNGWRNTHTHYHTITVLLHVTWWKLRQRQKEGVPPITVEVLVRDSIASHLCSTSGWLSLSLSYRVLHTAEGIVFIVSSLHCFYQGQTQSSLLSLPYSIYLSSLAILLLFLLYQCPQIYLSMIFKALPWLQFPHSSPATLSNP
jgi:hypothetical protein